MSVLNGPSLGDPVRFLKGVGPKKAGLLASLGIRTVMDLLDYFPFRIDDFSSVVALADIKPGDEATVLGVVMSRKFFGSRRGRALSVELGDGTGTIGLVWYNMPYVYQSFPIGARMVASGRVEWRRGGLEMAHPIWQQAEGDLLKGPIVPVYHATSGMTSESLRKIIGQAAASYADKVPASVPPDILDRHGYIPLADAYRAIHLPHDARDWQKARRTHAFCEILLLQIALMSMRKESESAKGPEPFENLELARRFLGALPFRLTGAQERAIGDLEGDLRRGTVMNRLLQGDVGSGKTVVAAYALLAAVGNGYQGVLLAPTEVLARQHKRTLESLCGDLCRIGFVTGSLTPKEKEAALGDIRSGAVQLVIGTHALLEPAVRWHRLGLVVTDEQHRFGVRQRLSLPLGNAFSPHVLVMSATPIPRSLALTLYGDLDISVIDMLPPGRKAVRTEVLTESRRAVAYKKVMAEVKRGRQAYVVCPTIREGKSDRKAAENVLEELQAGFLKGLRLGIVHGSLGREESDRVMQDFTRGEIDALVSTTVIEVGIDVPNATCMVIEDAGSFGLASLHQLRGRVGRGGTDSYCYLISDSKGEARERLLALEGNTDGFVVAELDLKNRGPGQFFGLQQHGHGETRLSDLSLSLDDIARARDEARRIVGGPATGAEGKLLKTVARRYGDLLTYGRSR